MIRGQVLSPENEPVPQARVTITALGSLARRTTETDARGRYTALFVAGEGEYLVSVRAIGFAQGTARVRRTGESNILIADLVLSRAPLQLDSVTVVADAGEDVNIGGSERDLLPGALFSLDPSSIDALLAQVPGLAYVPGIGGGEGGYSVLGVSPEQNKVLLDGMEFDGKSLPPGAIESARLATTTYNPAEGNFAGGQLSLTTRSGGEKFRGSIDAEMADPLLAWEDPRSPTPVAQNLRISGAASGPIKSGKAYFNLGISQTTNARDLLSLLSLNEAQRERYGLTPDTISTLGGTLDGFGVPLTTSDIPDESSTRSRSALLRVDLVPSATTTLALSGNVSDSRRLGSGISALGYPSLGTANESRNLQGQASFAAYFGGFINELSTSFQSSISRSEPLVSLPSGRVRVGTEYPDGRVGMTELSFGGGTAGSNYNSTRKWESKNELSWLTVDSRHKLSFGQSLAFEWTTSSDAANPFGTFTYQSSNDLAANRPASYTRTFSSSTRSTRTMTSALWVGGQSRFRDDDLRLQYGLRMDFNRVGSTPEYNPVLDSLFGVRTDQVPNSVGLSPRIGFSWQLGEPEGGMFWRKPPLTLSGGVGAFRGVVPLNRVTQLAEATGLESSIRQLTCVGDATPVPDWRAYAASAAAAPSTCLDGMAPVDFSTDVPSPRLFDPSYTPPTSWRGNLELRGLDLLGWPLSLGATYSHTVNVEDGVDLNLRRTAAFTLPEEGRPVFVSPDQIVPTTGAVAPGGSRISEQFGTVTSYVSDLSSRAVQFTARLSPSRPLFGEIPLSLQYTFNATRQQERGFGGSTAGDPWAREWSRGRNPTHEFRLHTSFGIPYASLRLQVRLASGTKYTPIVGGDVNGDGRRNDRAFVFDPAATDDPVLAAEMETLLGSATGRTRECLQAQLGRVAGRESCSTGWRLEPDINLDLRLPWQNFGMSTLGDRLNLSVTARNMMGALMRLLGLSNTSLGRISGANYPIDPTLLYVEGFDPETRRFQYRVNQQFGEGAAVRRQSARYAGAFQLHIGARVALGYMPPKPSLVRDLGLVSRDKKMPPPTEAEVRERLRRLTMNPLETILTLRDSLLLNDEQIQRLEEQSAKFQAEADSVLAPVVEYVVEEGREAKDDEVAERIGKVQREIMPMMVEALRKAVEELREEQRKRLPPFLQAMAG